MLMPTAGWHHAYDFDLEVLVVDDRGIEQWQAVRPADVGLDFDPTDPDASAAAHQAACAGGWVWPGVKAARVGPLDRFIVVEIVRPTGRGKPAHRRRHDIQLADGADLDVPDAVQPTLDEAS